MAQLRAKQIKLAANDIILGGATGATNGSNILSIGSEATVLKVISGSVAYGLQQAGDVVFAPGALAGALSSLNVNAALVEVNADLNTERSRAIGAEGSLNASIVVTNTAAGFAASNGSYVANVSTVYIGSATSLNDADVVLAKALFSVQGTLGALLGNIENAIGLNGDGTLTSLAGTYAVGGDTVVQAINALDTALNLNAGSLTTETSRAKTAEGNLYQSLVVIVGAAGLLTNGSYVPPLGSTYLSTATSLNNADSLLDIALASLANAYNNADSTLQTQLTNIENTVGLDSTGTTPTWTGHYVNLGGTATVVLAVEGLDGALYTEQTRAIAAEKSLNTSIVATNTAAGFDLATGAYVKAIGATYTIIGSATSVLTADQLLDTAIEAEITRATGAEQALGTLFSNTTGFQATGGTFSTNVYNGSNYLSTASSLQSADNLLDSALFTESTRAIHAEGTINTRLDNLTASQVAYVNGGSVAGALTATNVQDAVDQVNTKVNAIGSAFEYKGTLANNASAFPTTPRNGDVYKITGSGLGTIAGIVVDAGDSVVWDGTNWDILIHTEGQVFGTAGKIAVTGNTDVGFTVSIDSSYVGQTSIGTVGTIGHGTWEGDVVAVTYGGTGQSSFEINGLIFGNDTGALGTVSAPVDTVGLATVGFLQWTGSAFTWINTASLRAVLGATQRADDTLSVVSSAASVTLTLSYPPVGAVEVFFNGLKLSAVGGDYTYTAGSTSLTISASLLGYSIDAGDVIDASYNYAYNT